MTTPIAFQAPDPAELDPLFPGYHVLELIAQGGMGAVYQAHQVALDRTVALKILPREYSMDPAYREQFLAEARAMARLNCPGLIAIYDCGETDGGLLYIIMEFVQGQSLYHSAYGIKVDQAESCRLVLEICEGLAHAHEQGILHRDIKPANILLDLQAHPKIGDFGLARAIGSQEDAAGFGTPHYTAPEVISHPNAVDVRADIFSVGVILHELLTSKVPAADPRGASQIVNCDRRFDAIIARATHPVPSFRYASVREMAEELKALLAALKRPATAPGAAAPRMRPAATTPGVRRPGARAPRRVVIKSNSGGGGMGALAALVVIGLGVYGWMNWQKRQNTMAKTVEETSEQVEARKGKAKTAFQSGPVGGVAAPGAHPQTQTELGQPSPVGQPSSIFQSVNPVGGMRTQGGGVETPFGTRYNDP